jgi:hypothetical protein
MYRISEDIAPKILEWLASGVGVAVWANQNLSSSMSDGLTPGDAEGAGWQYSKTPKEVLKSVEDFEVSIYEEFKRFHVGVERYGMGFRITAGAQRNLNKYLERAGIDSTYEFDYSRQDAVVFKLVKVVPLTEWATEKQKKESENVQED